MHLNGRELTAHHHELLRLCSAPGYILGHDLSRSMLALLGHLLDLVHEFLLLLLDVLDLAIKLPLRTAHDLLLLLGQLLRVYLH